jgi:hypothetical protein
MTQPTLTKDALRSLISELLQEAITANPGSIAKTMLPKAERQKVDTEALAVKAFRRAGFGDVKPNVDVLTFNRWLIAGRRVKKGEHSIKVGGLRLFHTSQTEAMNKQKHAAALAALAEKREGKSAPEATPQAPAKPAKSRKARVVPITTQPTA